MEKLKTYCVEVVLRKLGPSAIRAAIAGFIALLAAHQNMLTQFGIVYDDALKTVTLHLDSLTTWLSVGGLGLITAFLRAGQHHAEATITGKPQSGDVRQEPTIPVVGGERKEDIQIAPQIPTQTETKSEENK